MTIKEDPTLEDALDGLMEAAIYCDENDLPALSYIISHSYQVVSRAQETHKGGETEWVKLDDIGVIETHGNVDITDTQEYDGELQLEVWGAPVVDEEPPPNHSDVLVEFWDKDDETVSEKLWLSLEESKELVTELLTSMDTKLID